MKRIFISFAVPEDNKFRDFIVGQSRLEKCPFEFYDFSVKEPYSDSWKTRCRTKIKGCDGVIALISPATINSGGARWEIKCAIEEGIPIIGIQVYSNNKGTVPPELAGKRVINWDWKAIESFINTL